MEKENKNVNIGFFVKITKEENDMVKEMKKAYCINMSQFIRNAIRDFYGELKNGKGEK